MNKDEILEKSRQDNQNRDPYEMEVNRKASHMGTAVSVLLCFILFVIQILLGGGLNYGLWSVILSAGGSASLYKGIKLKNKSVLMLGVSNLLCALLGAIAAVGSMLK